MNGLNPGEMADSFDYVNYQGGYINVNETQPSINFSLQDALGDINKQEILKKISNYSLSEEVKSFVDEYEQNFGERNIFLWKFLGTVFKEAGVTLSTIDKKYFDSITDDKLLFTIICAILDDVAELHRDKELLNEMISVLTTSRVEKIYENNEKIIFIKQLWKHLINKLKTYPRYEEFKDIFIYDFKQMLNALQYSYLVNENPKMLNLNETTNYDCHNMMVFIYNGIDLMVSPDFDYNELPYLRNAFWYAQQMARIGNWLSTWKREVKEKDISSGVFAYVFSNKIIEYNDFETLSTNEIIERIENSDVNEYFMNIWKENYGKLVSLKEEIKSVDMDRYIKGLEKVIKFHMASEGFK